MAGVERDHAAALPRGRHQIIGNATDRDHSPVPDEFSKGLQALSRWVLLAQQRNSPILVINGADDYFVPQSDTTIFDGRPRTHVHLVLDSGHVAMSGAAEIVLLITGWLRQQFVAD